MCKVVIVFRTEHLAVPVMAIVWSTVDFVLASKLHLPVCWVRIVWIRTHHSVDFLDFSFIIYWLFYSLKLTSERIVFSPEFSWKVIRFQCCHTLLLKKDSPFFCYHQKSPIFDEISPNLPFSSFFLLLLYFGWNGFFRYPFSSFFQKFESYE